MTSRTKKKPVKPETDQEPKFKRGDVVKLMGIPSPLMLVSKVANEPEEPDDEDEESEDGVPEGEFTITITVIWFNQNSEMQGDYGGQQFAEGLLELVTPAEKVREAAEANTKAARERGTY
jgi:hypothetical protein